ncbi:hypothetical protein [Leptospira sp. GIMC2001]|uniref:hypothetical protein n=1 Tax=Leptospira sp. GIMC2001 TaxID=1513297 RepID=UPI002349745D|nr:hypothetical protein [Leptospira sp. GIMC2001]WCL51470.1 hypothetical protein O4O04_20350 [Leptospira sp. GIMC2001]
MITNKFLIISLIFLYLLALSIFSFFLYNTRVIPNLTISIEKSELKNRTDNYLLINEIKLKELESKLERLNDANAIPNLIQIFEREREHYILLITLLFGLATIISAIFALSRFVEKNEYVRINDELFKLEERLEKEIYKLRINNFKSEIQQKSNLLYSNTNFILNGNRVSNEKSYLIYIEKQISGVAKNIDREDVNPTDDFIFILHNFFLAWLKNGKNRNFENNILFDVNNNKIFFTIIKEMSKNLNKDKFRVIFDRIEELGFIKYNLGLFKG